MIHIGTAIHVVAPWLRWLRFFRWWATVLRTNQVARIALGGLPSNYSGHFGQLSETFKPS